MSTRAVTPAAPAAAPLETPDNMQEALETGFLPDDPHYRLTGEFKDADTTEASAASKEEKKTETPSAKAEASAASSEADTSAASAAATTQETTKGPAQTKTATSSESRWAKMSRENKELRDRLARLEGAQSAQAPRETQQTSQPAAETKASTGVPRPKIDDLDPKTGKAKYATYGEYEAAKDDWLQKETLRQFQETSAKTQREQELARAEETLAVGFARKLDSSRKAHADFDAVALNPDLVIPKGSVTDGFLLDSEHAGEVLYYLGQHPEILEGFYGNHDPKTGRYVNKITPYAQARELTKLELKLSGQSSGATHTETTPVKPVTTAPRPPHQVSGSAASTKDAVEQAVEDGDAETYIREQNARELARRKGK